MRVISGKLKGRIIKGYEIDGTRATMDRVKESLFAMIQDYVKNSKCLDLFAGTGSLGIEALSNGATFVTFVDVNIVAVKTTSENLKNFNINDCAEVIHSDYNKFLKNCQSQYDLVFLDPPYKFDNYQEIVQLLVNNELLTDNALIIIESSVNSLNIDDFAIKMYKFKKYGNKYISIYKYQRQAKNM